MLCKVLPSLLKLTCFKTFTIPFETVLLFFPCRLDLHLGTIALILSPSTECDDIFHSANGDSLLTI